MGTRLYLDRSLADGMTLELDGDEAQYLGRALRLRTGDVIHIFNAEHGEFTATLDAFSKRSVTLLIGPQVLEPGATPPESPLVLHLVQGISRGERMDTVIQKTTELGVTRITPVLTAHGQVRLDDKRAGSRRAHWERIAISAAEQSGRLCPPAIDQPVALNDWFGANREADRTRLILDPGSNEALASVAPPTNGMCLLVGPEGGFSEKELGDADVVGFRRIGLGPRVLRTETAGIAAVLLAQARFGDLNA